MKVRNIFFGVGLTMLGGVLVRGSVNGLGYQSEVGVRFNFDPTLALDLSSSEIHIPNLAPGTSNISNEITVTVVTNNATGYTLTASAGNEDNASTKLSLNNDNYFSSIATDETITAFSTARTWGYTTDSGGSYSGLPLYSDSEKELNSSDAPTTRETGGTKFAIGAKAETGQAAGDYTNVINFKVVTNYVEPECNPGYICYNNNDADSSNTIADQAVSSNADVTLMPANFKKAGYGFAGWNTEADGTGVSYGPMETINVGDVSSDGIILYANWIEKSSDYTMQTFTDSVCKANLTPVTYNSSTGRLDASNGNLIALEDTRDGNVYTVARLADGNCWMVENLRLAKGSVALNTTNTDSPINDFSLPLSSASWCNSDTAECDNTALVNTGNITGTASEVSTASANILSYGSYYNYYAATAGHGDYLTRGKNDTTLGSVCPANWRLPSGGAYQNTSITTSGVTGTETTNNSAFNDFYKLVKASVGGAEPNTVDTTDATIAYYSGTGLNGVSNLMRSFPTNFLLSGSFSGANTAGQGTSGSYLSATANSSASSYRLSINSSNVGAGTDYSNKWDGGAVRCVAGDYSGHEMQDLDDYKQILAVDSPITVVDNRDSKTYKAMLARDGKVWMVQNLDLCIGCQGTAALTSENTDLNVISADNTGAYYAGYSESDGVITWTPANTTITSMNHTAGTVNGWSNSQTLPRSADPGSYYQTGIRFSSTPCNVQEGSADYDTVLLKGNQACNYLSDDNMNPNVAGARAYQYFSTTKLNGAGQKGDQGAVGNYYNWTAAIASNNSSSLTTSTTSDPANDNPKNSICPKGWRLPRIAVDPNITNTWDSPQNEFGVLYKAYGSSANGLFDLPLGFVRSGLVNSGSLNNAGNYGYYWSSTVESSTYARNLVFSSGYVLPAYNYNRSNGFSVRCVAE